MSNDNKINLSAPTLATFKAGDSVLCPSLNFTSFVLTADLCGQRKLLALTHDGSYFYYDDKGYFVPSSDKKTGDYQPSLFHDTEANRHAIATLYSGTPITQTSQHNVIDTTTTNDDEVILLTSGTVSNAACEVHGAAEILDDISSLLGLIYNGKINQSQAVSLARIAQVTTDTWSEILYLQLTKLNEPLSRSKFGAVEGKQ